MPKKHSDADVVELLLTVNAQKGKGGGGYGPGGGDWPSGARDTDLSECCIALGICGHRIARQSCMCDGPRPTALSTKAPCRSRPFQPRGARHSKYLPVACCIHHRWWRLPQWWWRLPRPPRRWWRSGPGLHGTEDQEEVPQGVLQCFLLMLCVTLRCCVNIAHPAKVMNDEASGAGCPCVIHVSSHLSKSVVCCAHTPACPCLSPSHITPPHPNAHALIQGTDTEACAWCGTASFLGSPCVSESTAQFIPSSVQKCKMGKKKKSSNSVGDDDAKLAVA